MPDDTRPTTDRRSAVTRRFLISALPLALGACVSVGPGRPMGFGDPRHDPTYLSMYGPMDDDGHAVPAIDLRTVKPAFLRRLVGYDTAEAPGTIVIDPAAHFLYLVNGDGTAMRYGVGVGREGFGWAGRATVRRKAHWPDWHPPVEMQARDERARQWADGMPGGLSNPLGARALYLFQGDRDTLYRIHGTNEPSTIGTSVSSGCIRMINQDVIDLYDRVPVGTPVVVLPAGGDVGYPPILGGIV